MNTLSEQQTKLSLPYFITNTHGYVRVSNNLLTKLGIKDHISKYSFEYANYTYIEEDFDLMQFIEACNKNNISYQFKEYMLDTNSFVCSQAERLLN